MIEVDNNIKYYNAKVNVRKIKITIRLDEDEGVM
jgi:hypothetical protein